MLSPASLPHSVCRVSRVPVWEWPNWAYAGSDGTFGNRFDDPESLYRVLYASASMYGCYLETLARFRPDLALYAELRSIDGDAEDSIEPGVVPWTWRRERCVGWASASGKYADILSTESIAFLRTELASTVIQLGFPDLDASALHSTAPRVLTQRVSRIAFEGDFDGIFYQSKYGNDIHNYAIFEGRVFFQDEMESSIAADDEELLRALAVHDLILEPSTEPIPARIRGIVRGPRA